MIVALHCRLPHATAAQGSAVSYEGPRYIKKQQWPVLPLSSNTVSWAAVHASYTQTCAVVASTCH
jgi:hypothetical protein